MNQPNPRPEPLHFWSFPWGYPQAVIVASALFLNGILLQAVTHTTNISSPAWPYNLYGIAGLWGVLFFVSWQWRENPIVSWLGGIPVSIVTLAYVGILALLAGVMPQGGQEWVTNITGSWPFVLLLLLLLLNLGLVTLRRLFEFSWKDWAFLSSHAGFWIVVAAMAFGAGDIQKYRMAVGENENTIQAVRVPTLAEQNSPEQLPTEMPFSITLKKFYLEEYHPQLGFYDAENQDAKMKVLGSDFSVGSQFQTQKLKLEIEKVIPTARRTASGFESTNDKLNEYALFVKVYATEGNTLVTTGWLAPGATGFPPVTLHTTAGIFVLLSPQAKLYRSNVELSAPQFGITAHPETIEVNKPTTFVGWKIYQSSYELTPDHQKFLSVFEVVRDPWLPVVYAGAFLMLLGACQLFWKGIKTRQLLGEDNKA